MISKYEKEIINKLLDKYEKSKSFVGENKVNQRFNVKISSVFPRYTDHSNYEIFQAVNEAVDTLVRASFIIAKANSAHVYSNVILNVAKLEDIYKYIGRKPKKDINSSVLNLMEIYKNKNQILNKYCETQYERIHSNKTIQFFNNDLEELENILIAVDELLKVDTETFARDFSVKVFKDSKVFERIAGKVVNLIYEFGVFPEKDRILGDLNIVKNPTHVNFKGPGSITINDQKIDLTSLSSDIAISSKMLSDIECIEVTGKAVITIENLTSFHTFSDKDMLAIYLGGYHNRVRREIIKKIHQQNSQIAFYHFGDIDAGGFYILEHLKRQTGVDFIPFKMDIETLEAHKKYTKRLTENDKKRLTKLVDSQYHKVINYMLENNCKLEQEAVNVE
ncbi:Wadjet anti-phage system protein JetD domain-containing protein [Robertmurraya massiliosenegalensis]|uniref:Wadjet anti-phage system protein JetD domain-containing protein n=1 Tax=Robertmurraya massiliosenegalensis TaxID=1287657 RepID=UPI000307E6F9|nr:Wadjet anti-phage system protein JetD domain-containing protein [Robertmurraya massiliosenegalensis]